MTEQENRKCENCSRNLRRAAYIPFNGGMVACNLCCQEWGRLGAPKTIAEYHRAIIGREDYHSDLIAKKQLSILEGAEIHKIYVV